VRACDYITRSTPSRSREIADIKDLAALAPQFKKRLDAIKRERASSEFGWYPTIPSSPCR